MAKHKIVLIGAGNVAWHLGHTLQKAGHAIVQVWSRTNPSAQALADELETEFTNSLDALTKTADIYIIAVKDYAIDDVILSEIKLPGKLVVHTSGSVPMLGLEHISEKHGIFYPLQTFTQGEPVTFDHIPIFIEAIDDEVKATLTELARSISDSVHYFDSDNRKAIHVAAVFVNNFTNYMYGAAQEIMEREGMDFSLLAPLMEETMRKAQRLSPKAIQTGPAKRNDLKTIEEHLQYLNHFPDMREVYLVLTENLLREYNTEANTN